jgi:hypothetical protein
MEECAVAVEKTLQVRVLDLRFSVGTQDKIDVQDDEAVLVGCM